MINFQINVAVYNWTGVSCGLLPFLEDPITSRLWIPPISEIQALFYFPISEMDFIFMWNNPELSHQLVNSARGENMTCLDHAFK